jgi:hypothetical protein
MTVTFAVLKVCSLSCWMTSSGRADQVLQLIPTMRRNLGHNRSAHDGQNPRRLQLKGSSGSFLPQVPESSAVQAGEDINTWGYVIHYAAVTGVYHSHDETLRHA